MDNQTGDFDKILQSQAETRRLQNFDDLQNEMAGVEVGRMARFLSPEARELLLNKRNGKVSGSMTALDLMLLNDPAYAELYASTMTALQKAEQATEKALEKALKKTNVFETELSNTLSRAKQLPNGTRVFKDKQGAIWTEDDVQIDPDIARTLDWSGLEPSFEIYKKQKQNLNSSQLEINDIRKYQTDVLGHIRGELTDHNNPKPVDDIEVYNSQIHDLMPQIVEREFSDQLIPIESNHTANITIPKLD